MGVCLLPFAPRMCGRREHPCIETTAKEEEKKKRLEKLPDDLDNFMIPF